MSKFKCKPTLRRLLTAAGACLLVAASQSIAAQDHKPQRALKPWQPRLTEFGQPDLQGTWTNGTATPFERPAELASSDKLNAQQAAALEQRAEDFRTHRAFKPTDIGHDNEAFIDIGYKVLSTMQASMVVEPANGKLPIRPEAEVKRDFNLNNFDSFESMSPWDRCITRGPASLLPANYNNGYQIVQTPTHVMIVAEMIHEARVIKLSQRHHLDERVTSWEGDSIGHWEGNTLVVDTTNFNGKGWLATQSGAGRLRGIPYTTALHVVERFTRTSDTILNYEISVDDPSMYSGPWKIAMPFTRDDAYTLYEYACHEGNSATESILRGARVQESKATESQR